MKSVMIVISICLVTANVSLASTVGVGASSLIGTLDYSDTFTLPGTLARDNVTAWEAYAGNQLRVENSYGNSALSWIPVDPATNAYFFRDTNRQSILDPNPMADTGIMNITNVQQYGVGNPDASIAYGGLRDDVLAQVDAIQTNNRVGILFGNRPDCGSGISVWFYADDKIPPGAWPGTVVIFNGDNGLWNFVPGMYSGRSVSDQTWHNYAVHADIPNQILEIFMDEVSLGTVDLNTFVGGAYAGLMSTNFISIGSDYTQAEAGPMIYGHFDNFQVGTYVPEPATMTLFGFGILGLLRRKR